MTREVQAAAAIEVSLARINKQQPAPGSAYLAPRSLMHTFLSQLRGTFRVHAAVQLARPAESDL